MQHPKVVLDTSIVVSGLISPSGSPFEILRMWQLRELSVIVSSSIADEYRRVADRIESGRRVEMRGFPPSELRDLLARRAFLVLPLAILPIYSRDPNDDMFLAAAIEGNAEFLVTGDKDLLVLAREPAITPLRIVTAGDFVSGLE